jgi:hypothetical protein
MDKVELSGQVPKIVRIVLASLLLSLGIQNAAFAVLASIEQAKQVGNSFQETVLFDLLSQDNSSFLLTKPHRDLYRTAHKTSSIQQLVKTSHLNSDYSNPWRMPTAIILSQRFLPPSRITTPPTLPPSRITTPPTLPPSRITTPPTLPPSRITTPPTLPSPGTIPEIPNNTITEPGTIPAASSSIVEEVIIQKVRALQAEGKNLSPAVAEWLLGVVEQLRALQAEGRNLSPADAERLLEVVEQRMKDSNSTSVTPTSVTARAKVPVRVETQQNHSPTQGQSNIQGTDRYTSPKPPTSIPSKEWGLRDNHLTPDKVRWPLTFNSLGSPSIIVERSPNGYAILRPSTDQVVKASTIISFYDEVLPKFIHSIPDDDSPIRIFLSNFTPDEAKAFALTGDIRQKVHRRDSSYSENIALLNRSYNWNDATIKEVKIKSCLVGSASGYGGIIDIEVASTNPTRPSLRIRIITFFKVLPKEIASRIKAIIQRVLNRYTDKSRTVNQIAVEIHKELKKEFPDIDLNVQIDTCDMYITQPAIWNRFAAVWNRLAHREL